MKICPRCMKDSPQEAANACSSCGYDLTGVSPVKPGDRTGQEIAGKFRLHNRIGVGAMGSIWKAEQLSLGKTVVIKLLHKHLLSDNTLSKRFHREARASARLSHPNAITILDFGQTEEGLLYIAMEYVDGMDLAQLLHKEHPLDLERVVHILKQVCGALDEAHAKGIIHRDLKPENIMVTNTLREKDFVKVLDFGIAKLQDRGDGRDSFQTMAGIVCGTPEYMSPEQARGEELDARSDLYALGVILYQLTTGKLPFTGDSPIAVVTRHLTDQPREPRELNKDIPPSLNGLILRLMAKKRDKRPPNALALMKELEGVEMALGMTGDTVQHPSSPYAAAVSGGEESDKTSVVRKLPSDLMREIESAGKTPRGEPARTTSSKEPSSIQGLPSEHRLRKVGSPIPRPPVAARRGPRAGSGGPLRPQMASPPSAAEPSNFDASSELYEGGDKTLVVPGIGGAVLEQARREAATRQRQRELYDEVPERSAAPTPIRVEQVRGSGAPDGATTDEADVSGLDDDMHGQRTVALAAPQIAELRRRQAPLEPRRNGTQSWVVYVLAFAAVLGVGSYFLIRFLF